MNSLTETAALGDVFATLGLDSSKGPYLLYNYDPMCSWCWGFSSVWHSLLAHLSMSAPDVDVVYIAGGLAPDSDQPMPEELAQTIASHWRRIQSAIPGTEFNFDFWRKNTPRRSTYPACRAVLAVSSINSELEQSMIDSIARAYYLEAKNPSDLPVLTECAERIGVAGKQFMDVLSSSTIEQKLQAHLSLTQHLQTLGVAQGFPSLVMCQNQQLRSIQIDYNNLGAIVEQLNT